MKKGLSELVFILDRSGSMESIREDARGAFNSFLEDQKKVEGEATLTLVMFDHEYLFRENGTPLDKVEPLGPSDYVPRGSTALLDAIGRTINTIGERLSKLPEDERPEHVIVAIMTDGHENASSEFNKAQIKKMIVHQTEVYKWDFMFLGANQDAIQEGAGLGIAVAANFIPNTLGVASANSAYTSATTAYRGGNRSVAAHRIAELNEETNAIKEGGANSSSSSSRDWTVANTNTN